MSRQPENATIGRMTVSFPPKSRIITRKATLQERFITADLNPENEKSPLFLDDLHVGQRFTSGRHPIDEEQIKMFARQFDPQPFHLDAEAAKETLFQGLVASGWHTAAITMRLLVEGGLALPAGSSGLAARSPGPGRHDRATSCKLTAKSSKLGRPDRVRIAA